MQLADGAAVTVGITDAYVHLGSRLDASSSDSPDPSATSSSSSGDDRTAQTFYSVTQN